MRFSVASRNFVSIEKNLRVGVRKLFRMSLVVEKVW